MALWRMRRAVGGLLLLLAMAFAGTSGVLASQPPSSAVPHIEAIAFFGYKGLEIDVIRDLLPIRDGSLLPTTDAEKQQWKTTIRASIEKFTGSPPTDIAVVCCDTPGRHLVYIGLEGESTEKLVFHRAPAGRQRLEPRFIALCREVVAATVEAVAAGRAGEDESHGYSLSTESQKLRELQIAVRDYAQHHTRDLIVVARKSADAEHRTFAAFALGYARHNAEQTRALAYSSLDPDDGVRNAALRALSVMLMGEPEMARLVPVGPFVGLLKSGRWTDRNKASVLLSLITLDRDPKKLAALRTRALSQLKEIARWPRGHNTPALQMLGRIAGFDEAQISQTIEAGQAEKLIQAL